MNPLSTRRYVELCERASYFFSKLSKNDLIIKVSEYIEHRTELTKLQIKISKIDLELKKKEIGLPHHIPKDA